ncbi:hypothetical protein PGT21_010911 [Puccinia graminis f. sp. tritici]|uniref:AAA+ ATPase domain-containing protein n=1 Tax=Puccinia graminis f. sp. tritici TaxID=56615 RepID=A0A5B0PRH8_PUCGR|nr:hypothetical protein PGT21_010911 [Puccinia graminis f. sp. tritici]
MGMLEEIDELEVDEAFFGALQENHSVEESEQAKALIAEGDIEGEASEARRSHHTFQDICDDPQSLLMGSRRPRSSSHELVPELDEDEEEPADRSVKKSKLDSVDTPHQNIVQDSISKEIPDVTHNAAIVSNSRQSENRKGVDEGLNGLDVLELDEAFPPLPGQEPGSEKENNDNDSALAGPSKGREGSLATLELEIDESFMVPMKPIPQPSVPAFERIRRDEPISDSPVSFDEMMDEAENHGGGDDLLEIDSQFGDSHLNRPTSAQAPIPAFNSRASLLQEEAEPRRDLSDPYQARWVPTASIMATRLDGTQFRIPRRKKIGSTQVTRGGAQPTEALRKQCLELLDEPIHRMLQAVREEILHKDALAVASASLPPKVETSNPGPRSLWTDRYRPVKFIDLIGDERTFRSAMSWLKTWDRCVFKKVESNKRKRQSKVQPQWNANGPSNSFAEAAETDPYGRPHEKVLLLAGKPGLGKTTMAEVLATQAGYQVIEINASDDRSSRTVTDQIKSALESRTLDAGAKFGGGLSLKSNRPTCVIIDEIDGAAAGGGGGGGAGGSEAGFVKALVKLVTEGSSNAPKFNSKGKSLDQRPLLRPIICICNDLYAPVLRPLRPISRIIRFNNPTPLTIVKRLQTICKSEKLLADLNNLNYLVKLASGDLRSCLNTLQFISTQSTTLTDQIIKSAVEASVKDSGSSIQTVLSHLFKIPVRKSANKDSSGSKNSYLNDLVRDISACGQNDRIIQGCFESYLGMKQPTDLWQTYDRLHEWLDFHDRLETKIWKEQEYQLSGYVPYSIAIWRELMGNVTNKAPDYPKIDYEHFLKRSINEETLSSFNSHLPPIVKASFKSQEVVCELLPFLIRILSVDLRPVNSKLIKKEEKDVLARLVSIMIELGLKFVQDKSEDGQLSYTLEPAVDFPVYYEGKRPIDIPPPRYSVRQMILNEMNLLSRARKQDRPTTSSSDAASGTAASIINAYKQKPNGLKSDLPEKVALDFFGRKRVETDPKKCPDNGQKDLPKEKIKILYRYHEGFSNAVKKGITFNELMMK